MPQDTTQFLAAVYAAEHLPLSAAELDRFAARYSRARAAADAMHEFPAAKYEDPAVAFSARPRPATAGGMSR